ncbi:MAG TPA: aldo/keto reductase, partial [Acidimicrobiales bacterium]|nr:aldo/keto reductase [Acidimicrobiales bacterium]
QYGGDWGPVDEGAAVTAIKRAWDAGINFFDTAQAYGFGRAEGIVGRALADELAHNREGVVLATKGGLRMAGERLVRDSSPEWLRRGVESSLEALRTDHIDLYQVHWPDPATPLVETAEALRELRDEGLIGHVGVSNYSVDQIAEFSRALAVETVQPPYHLFRRDIEADLLPYAQDHDTGVLVYGPLAHGLLGGTMTAATTFPDDDWRSHHPAFTGAGFRANLAAVDALALMAARRGATAGQLALAWVLGHPAVQVAIVGSRHPDHLAESIGALDLRLDDADRAEIERIMATAQPIGGPAPEAMT